MHTQPYQGVWLKLAYRLEFVGEERHFAVWVAGLVFVAVNAGIVVYLIKHHRSRSQGAGFAGVAVVGGCDEITGKDRHAAASLSSTPPEARNTNNAVPMSESSPSKSILCSALKQSPLGTAIKRRLWPLSSSPTKQL